MLRGVQLLVRDVARSRSWWSIALGPPVSASDTWAKWGGTSAGAELELLQVDNEAMLSTGYGPFLQVSVPGVADRVPQLLMAGGHLDGAIQHLPGATVATIRSPDGHTVSFVEDAQPVLSGGH